MHTGHAYSHAQRAVIEEATLGSSGFGKGGRVRGSLQLPRHLISHAHVAPTSLPAKGARRPHHTTRAHTTRGRPPIHCAPPKGRGAAWGGGGGGGRPPGRPQRHLQLQDLGKTGGHQWVHSTYPTPRKAPTSPSTHARPSTHTTAASHATATTQNGAVHTTTHTRGAAGGGPTTAPNTCTHRGPGEGSEVAEGGTPGACALARVPAKRGDQGRVGQRATASQGGGPRHAGVPVVVKPVGRGGWLTG